MVDSIAVIIAALAAVAAFWVAFEAKRSAAATQASTKATMDTAEAALMKAFFDDYFDQTMSDALRLLVQWKEQHDNAFASKWVQLFLSNDSEAEHVDRARRKVKGYFEKALHVFSAGVVRPNVFRQIISVAALNVYYDILDPLELALNPDRSSATKDLLWQCCGRYREAERVVRIPPTGEGL